MHGQGVSYLQLEVFASGRAQNSHRGEGLLLDDLLLQRVLQRQVPEGSEGVGLDLVHVLSRQFDQRSDAAILGALDLNAWESELV